MISVCIATYNGGYMLKTQLESIIPQLSDNDEIVISEDGNMNALREITKTISYPKIRIVEGARIGNAIYNFENCLKQAKGDIIFLSDQDDKWLPNKVKCMVEALEDADCVCSDCMVTDEHFNVKEPSFYSLIGINKGKYSNLFIRNCYLGCCMAFKRNVLQKALPFPKKLPMHDIWIGNVAAFFFKMKFIDDKLILFRRHANNTSTTAKPSTSSLMMKINYRYQIIKDLLKIVLAK